MKLLAIDTSTVSCSAALYVEGKVTEQFQLAPREAASLILPMLESLLAEAGISLSQLDSLAFGCGPGSFTGVRIATGVIQGIALGAGLPVVPVSTLAALAQGVNREHGDERVLAALDARMQEVYWGAYEKGADGLMTLVGEERVALPQNVPFPEGDGWAGAGSGWDVYATGLEQQAGERVRQWYAECHPHAQDIAVLAVAGFEQGKAVAAELALPVYLRDEVTWKKIGEQG